MRSKLHHLFIMLALIAGINQAVAQLPVITSFSQNGLLVCSNLLPGSVASVQWASSSSGPWQTNWAGLEVMTVASNGLIQVSVPMFYRVLGVAQGTNSAPPPNMVLIPAGSFTMGDTLDSESDATPISVTVSVFYMDMNLVSYSQWQSVYNWATNYGYGFDDAGSGKATNHPVQTVNWYDVVKWSNARSQQAGLNPVYYTDAGLTQVYMNGDVAPYVNWAANGYRLPTEAEWEKAARGGLVGQRFPRGDTISWSQANYYGDPLSLDTNGLPYDFATATDYDPAFSDGDNLATQPFTSPVGYFAPNSYGLYDMAGNVDEWCWDWYGTPYGQPTTTNPTGPASGGGRVLRGGDWGNEANFARCANRANYDPTSVNGNLGFRCVRGL